MSTMETVKKLVTSSRNIRERDPRVFGRGKLRPMDEIFITVTNFSTI